MIKPVFSIITPTNNRPTLLKRCIESVVTQSFDDFEQIVVDDANNPETAKVVAALQDKRIRYYVHEQPCGASAAYNTGIKMAKGSFICFLDDDDEYLPGILEKINQLFKDTGNSLGFVWTGITRVRDTDNGEKVLLKKAWPRKFKTIEEGLMVATGIGNGFGVCVRKICIDEIGLYDETLMVSADTDSMIRLAKKFEFRTVPEVLVKIHHHGNTQLTSKKNHNVRWECYGRIMERHFDFLSRYGKVFHAHSKAYAGLSYFVKKKKTGRKTLWTLIRKHPFKWIHYADFICFELFEKHFYQWKRERKRKQETDE